MADVTTIQSLTVFAWFMMLMILRRCIILIMGIYAGRYQPYPLGTQVPEDNMFKREEFRSPTPVTSESDFCEAVRVNRVIHNDSENDTYFLIMLLSTAVTGDAIGDNCIRTIVYGSIYLAVRLFYAAAYIMAWQPWRMISFSLGLLCTLACSIHLVITMSTRAN
jgi:uncharacterized MAPEG superfamily protein